MGNQITGKPVYEKVWNLNIVKPYEGLKFIFGSELINDEKIPFFTNNTFLSVFGSDPSDFIEVRFPGYTGLLPIRININQEYKTINKGVNYILNYGENRILKIIAIDTVILKSDNTYGRNVEILQKNDLISVPIINIQSQTLIDGSDIGNTIFKIDDEIFYYNKIPEDLNKCKNHEIPKTKVKTTLFDLCQVEIGPVVIGTAKNWFYKTVDIYNKLGKDKIGLDFKDFRLNMLLYALLKYILARLIYGKFNTKYLLNKYYNKFLNDLKDSRFCEAYNLFMDKNSKFYGYEIYFK